MYTKKKNRMFVVEFTNKNMWLYETSTHTTQLELNVKYL